MNGIAYCLAVGLAAVFAWAGVAKLRFPRRTRRAFRALNVDPTLARLVPMIELALALALVVAPRTGIVAVLLVGVFTVVLARADDGVSCACFGSASSEPVSWVQLVRNGMLAAAAGVAATARPVVPDLAAVLAAAGIAAIAVVVLSLADLKRRTGAVLRVRTA